MTARYRGDVNVAGTLTASAVANPTFTGQVIVPAGSASAPAISPTGDTNNGVFFPAADVTAIATGGSERLRIDSSGRLGLGATPQTTIHTYTSGSNATLLTGDAGADVYVRRASTNASAPNIYMDKARGSNAAPDVVASGDGAGAIYFRAWDGAAWQIAGAVAVNIDATPGASDMPGRLAFFTTADGSASTTERMRIDSNGLITGTGTSLGAWTAYTPTLGGTGWAIGNGTVSGAYCQIGKIVLFRAAITMGSTSTFGAAAFPTISLPVTESGTSQPSGAHAVVRDTSLGNWYTAAVFAASTSAWGLFTIGTDGLRAAYSATVPFTWANSDLIQIRGFYEAA